MKSFVANFTQHIHQAVDITATLDLIKIKSFRNVIVSGLGGSGIGASIVEEMIQDELKVPYIVNKGYFLPRFADKNTLLIINSYSGNTEETVHVIEQAIEKKLSVICISAGGKIEELAKKHQYPHIKLPLGLPPRASLGFSLVALIFILQTQKLISKKPLNQLKKAADFIDKQQNRIQKEAEKLAKILSDKLPILYAADGYESILVRWRQQINENAKQLCWHHVIPEMNHNELVGWRTKDNHLAAVFLRNDDDYIRIQHRIEINKKTIGNYTDQVLDCCSRGKNKIEKMIYLINLGDWLSCYLAEMRSFDPIEVRVIDELKSELSKL